MVSGHIQRTLKVGTCCAPQAITTQQVFFFKVFIMPVKVFDLRPTVFKGIKGYAGKQRYKTVNNQVLATPSDIPYSWKAGKVDVPKTDRTRAFKVADGLYSLFPDPVKLLWRKAVKKHGISGYNLYMLECVACFVAGNYAPDCPSISGGYGYKKITPGAYFPPPSETLSEYQWIWENKKTGKLLDYYYKFLMLTNVIV
jgi:hypothetical protein